VVVAALVVGVIILAVVASLDSSHTETTATYTSLGWEWQTGTLCDNFAIASPATPFTESAGQDFNVSWDITCTAGGPSTVTAVGLVDEAITGGSSSGTLVSSNAPVTIVEGSYTTLNVTVQAPSASYDGPLNIYLST